MLHGIATLSVYLSYHYHTVQQKVISATVATFFIDLGGSARKHHNTPVNQGLASLTSPDAVEELGARVLSPTEDSVAEVYEGEGLMNKSMGTPGENDYTERSHHKSLVVLDVDGMRKSRDI